MIRAIINRLKQNEKGFTLIELMVVVAIIGILAAGIIPQFMSATNKSKEAAAKADLANFKTVLEIIYAESTNGQYPADGAAWTTMYSQGYIKSSSAPKDPWGTDYAYDSSGSTYTITANGGRIVASPDGITVNP